MNNMIHYLQAAPEPPRSGSIGVMIIILLGVIFVGIIIYVSMKSHLGRTIQISPNVPLFFIINGKQSGPYKLEDVRSLIIVEKISRNTLFWQQGMSQWQMVSSSPLIMSYFQSK
jgi:flagellar basal body-associated protein FliL